MYHPLVLGLKTMLEFNIYYSHIMRVFSNSKFYFNVSLLSSFCDWKNRNTIITDCLCVEWKSDQNTLFMLHVKFYILKTKPCMFWA